MRVSEGNSPNKFLNMLNLLNVPSYPQQVIKGLIIVFMETNIKINSNNLALLSKNVTVPTYDRSKIKTGIAHIGIGGFHRAHQALYTDELLQNHNVAEWGICGIGLLDFDKKICDILKDQDGLYTLITKELDGSLNARVIGSLVEILFAPENHAAVIEKLADPDTKIISLTITEGGYNYKENTGMFDFSTPSIQWDLDHPKQPKTVFGYLTQALKLRKAKSGSGCTIQSCDNIPGNGNMTRDMLISYINRTEPDLLEWVKEKVSFPNSMVDRITPVTLPSDIDILRENFQIDDQWPVVCESFKQWVVEDDFIAGRPKWELDGAQFVENVAPYEKMKLSMLNAGHSALGIFGALHGYNTIDQSAENKEFQVFLRDFMDNEVTPVLGDLEGIDLDSYKDSLMARFKNQHIKDQISRICLESSAKIPKFLLPTLKAQLKKDGPVSHVSFVIAAWCKYNQGIDQNGNTYEIKDVIADELRDAAMMSNDDPISFLKVEKVFGDMYKSERFVSAYIKSLEALNKNTVLTCLEEINNHSNSE